MIVYEQPLSERVRLFLRLELLVKRFRHHLEKERRSDTLSALTTLLELYNLSARIDLKSDVIKEIDRISQQVRRSMESDDEPDFVERSEMLERLSSHSSILYQQRGPLGQQLRSHVFFNTLLQRTSLPGGVNGFDIPLLNFWLERGAEERTADLREWGIAYMKTADAATYLLSLIRNCCHGEDHTAQAGFFQMSIPTVGSYQMLQVVLPDQSTLYPEISAGKQRFSLRFVEVLLFEERGKQVRDDVPFTLKLCSF